MLEELKQEVYIANMMLQQHGLVTFTWGNVSGIHENLMVIKPSGVPYDKLAPEHMVVVDIATGSKVEGEMKPSSDTPTHVELYRVFKDIGGVVHTHSRWATTMAQAGRPIRPYGTTHGDYFYGEVPCTRRMTKEEIEGDYERYTGRVITDCFQDKDYRQIPGVLVHSHGPFTWGKDSQEAVYHAVVLEEIAFMAWHDEAIQVQMPLMQQDLLDKHFLRKHGDRAYYGQ